jgi:hypothetical protein
MKRFDLQGIELGVPAAQAFEYIADASHLPDWTNAFAEISGATAVMQTPDGEVEVGLEVRAVAEEGTVDWIMTFPDGSVATAFSRVVPIGDGRCAYTFVLTPPPVPLEMLEGALEAQSAILGEELACLQSILAAS